MAAAKYDAGVNSPRVFNVGAGKGVSLNQLIEALRQVVRRPIEVKYTGGRPEDVPANVLDISLAKQLLNWQPEVSLIDGLTKTWNWLQPRQLV